MEHHVASTTAEASSWQNKQTTNLSLDFKGYF